MTESRPSAVLLACFLLAFGPPGAEAQSNDRGEQGRDVLNLGSGAVVLSWSSQWDEEWAALLLLDDSAERGWSAGEGTDFPHEILIELAETTELRSVALDNSGALEADYPGISARHVEIWASNEGPEGSFRKVVDGEVAQGARSSFEIASPTPARWLKLKVLSNWGHEAYTELMELEAYGTERGVDGPRPELAGTYRTNYDLMRFEQTGTRVRGCYDFDGGTLAGSTDGRVVQFEWRENEGSEVGTAIMVLASSGERLNGLWYHDGAYEGLWLGTPAEDGVRPECTIPTAGTLEQSLASSGSAILYGIRFDVASAELRPESEGTLREALQTLESRPEMRLVVEGHTDAVGDEEANERLSERRARAVVAWLVDRGIAPDRLQPRGAGESEPVAGNDTAQGRALNRRVELERIR